MAINLRVFLRPELRTILDASWFSQVVALLLMNRDVAVAVFNSNSVPGFTKYYNGDLCGLGIGQCIESEFFSCPEAALAGTFLNRGATMKGADIFLQSFPDLQWSYVFALAGIKRLLYERGRQFDPSVEVLKSKGVKIVQINR